MSNYKENHTYNPWDGRKEVDMTETFTLHRVIDGEEYYFNHHNYEFIKAELIEPLPLTNENLTKFKDLMLKDDVTIRTHTAAKEFLEAWIAGKNNA